MPRSVCNDKQSVSDICTTDKLKPGNDTTCLRVGVINADSSFAGAYGTCDMSCIVDVYCMMD